jgi:hypothetical protein
MPAVIFTPDELNTLEGLIDEYLDDNIEEFDEDEYTPAYYYWHGNAKEEVVNDLARAVRRAKERWLSEQIALGAQSFNDAFSVKA